MSTPLAPLRKALRPLTRHAGPQAPTSYASLIAGKAQLEGDHGFAPLWLADQMFDFQRYLTEWALRKGRAAVFADCGLGKSLISLVWCENVVRKTNQATLILTPLAVASQFLREAERFGIGCARATKGKPAPGIYITNYERLHHLDPDHFAGVVCDESSILKGFDGATRARA